MKNLYLDITLQNYLDKNSRSMIAPHATTSMFSHGTQKFTIITIIFIMINLNHLYTCSLDADKTLDFLMCFVNNSAACKALTAVFYLLNIYSNKTVKQGD